MNEMAQFMVFVHFLGFLDNDIIRLCDQSGGLLEVIDLAYVAINSKEGENLQMSDIKVTGFDSIAYARLNRNSL
ncbi:hypothetical protein llap_1048 [Limosa lapponica baueri]|uniref:Uncharacterized protein n=1 Tax=Limosa lapponica baueri TaxID=1758121 RepID=A0A2I0URQ4_LIMLA|nr:hypothetical protein llap_1048 [Limosa lapponica baueri]